MRRARLEHQTDDLRSYCSPAVSRLLAENGLVAADLTGTGRGGRVTRRDVVAELARRGITPEVKVRSRPPEPAPVHASSTELTTPAITAGGGPGPAASEEDGVGAPSGAAKPPDSIDTVPFSRIRQRTADRMMASLAGAAHALVITEVDYAAVDTARSAEKEAF